MSLHLSRQGFISLTMLIKQPYKPIEKVNKQCQGYKSGTVCIIYAGKGRLSGYCVPSSARYSM